MTKNKIAQVNLPSTSPVVDPQVLAQLVRDEVAALAAKLKSVRGTRDMAPLALESAEVTPIAQRIEAALSEPRSMIALIAMLGEPAGRVEAAMRAARQHLYNAGTADAPAWHWIVDDGADTARANASILALIKYRPMTFAELGAATGVRPGRISGAMVRFQRDGLRLVNLGAPNHARWFLLPDDVKIKHLKSSS
jgi:hypothetical protein